MPIIKLRLEGDGHPWEDLPKRVTEKDPTMHYDRYAEIQIARLRNGMKSGKSSLMIRIDLSDGHSVVVETSVATLLSAASAIEGAEQYDGLA